MIVVRVEFGALGRLRYVHVRDEHGRARVLSPGRARTLGLLL